MKIKKLLVTLTALMLLAALPVFALAEDGFGSSAVTAGQTYTLEQMLTYAIQDEYMAQAEYAAILSKYQSGAPLSNIARAEETHISFLKTLFAAYGFTLPENTAAARVAIPATLEEAYQAGVQAENANIAMYDTFLAQTGLPEDVRETFTALRNASQSHLAAFTRNTQNSGLGMGMQNGRKNGGMNAGNTANCPMGDACPMNGSQDGRNSRMGMGGYGRNGRN